MAAVIVLALVLVACGAESSAGHGTAAAHADPALQLARCMRAHGVSNFPDPGAGGPVVVPSGVNADAPAFVSAQRACARLLPGGATSPQASASTRAEMLTVARCVRAHGVPDFPDPTASPPSSAAPHTGVALGRGGCFLVVRDPNAPAFKHAAAVCHFPLPPAPTG